MSRVETESKRNTSHELHFTRPESARETTKDDILSADRVNVVDTLPSLILFTLDPVPVEIDQQPVDVVGSRRVAVPLLGVVNEERQVVQGIGCLSHASEVTVDGASYNG